jgi:hypothetical protein
MEEEAGQIPASLTAAQKKIYAAGIAALKDN